MWTKFMDMHSGGWAKEDWEYIYIEAPQKEAELIFYHKFGHNPNRVTCTCCGEDYSIDEHQTLEQATAYERGCKYDEQTKQYLEQHSGRSYPYQTVDEYIKSPGVKVIYANEIKPEERTGELPEQGYVWVE